jgi:hypothetical protein
MDIKQRGEKLLSEWELCKDAKPKGHVIDLQIERDGLARWANNLSLNLNWAPNNVSTVEAVYQFEHRLKSYQEKAIIEILKNGAV